MITRCIRPALLAAACVAGAVQAQAVQPPPLPIGSLQARPEPGLSEPERKRQIRAHNHKFQHAKDYTRDDSLHGHEHQATGAARPAAVRGGGVAASLGSGSAAGAVQGGAGTGPAREQTGKGASSYFHGDGKSRPAKKK